MSAAYRTGTRAAISGHPSTELFTANRPKGIKVPIALEELGVPHELKKIALGSADLRAAEYLPINPSEKMPAIRHHTGTAVPVTVFESGAVLLYLAEACGGLLGTRPWPDRA